MSNREAIHLLKQLKIFYSDNYRVAIEMAIKAIERMSAPSPTISHPYKGGG